jgi:exodeoxyribonuclease III
MDICSWNVNSLNIRRPHLEEWLKLRRPDVVALQETKLEDEHFPDTDLASLGYRSVFSGQKSYNGVAILSRLPIADEQVGIGGFADEQRRVIAATIDDVRVVNVYVVNGQAVGSEKYAYKLRWLEALHDWLQGELVKHPRLVLLGDFNIAPDDRDVHDPAVWNDDHILTSTAERQALRKLQALGLHDSHRLDHEDAGQFTWWDYRAAAYRRHLGLRIDLALVSDALRERCTASRIDRDPRMWERPSDHAPVGLTLA